MHIYTWYICCCGHRINQSTGVKIYDLKHNHNNCLPLCICVCVCGEAFHALIISWRRNSREGFLPFSLPLSLSFCLQIMFVFPIGRVSLSFLFQLFSSTNLCKQFSVSMRRIPPPLLPSRRRMNRIIKKPSFSSSSSSSSWGRLQRSNGNAKSRNYTQIWIAWKCRRQS